MHKTTLSRLKEVATHIGATIDFKEESYREIVTFTWQRKYVQGGGERYWTEQEHLYIHPATNQDRIDTGIKNLAGIFADEILEGCWLYKEDAKAVRKCMRKCHYITEDEYEYAYVAKKGGKK